MCRRNVLTIVALAVLGSLWVMPANAGPVQIFILAGQSNMEGHGEMEPIETEGTLEYIVDDDPGTYGHLLDGSNWAVLDDVWIWYKRGGTTLVKGGISAGYGAASDTIGPEMQFGHVMGDFHTDQVLIIKTAWGGKSLAVDFRPPSSGWSVNPPVIAGDEGFYYQEMMDFVDDVLNNLETYFPAYDDQGYEIAGFGWHQGWNDRVNQDYADEYEENMENFINDVRTDLDIAELPFVIATTGMAGWDETHPRALQLMAAQLAMEDFDTYPDFEGNVAVVDTRDFWQTVAESPADQSYHWNRNAKTYYLIGGAMAGEMMDLIDAVDTTAPTPNPATFSSAPAAVSSTAITMTATTGSDTSGPVQYYFNETSSNPGATDSGWVTNPVYSDTGLDADTQYTYTVQMRDSVPNTGTVSSAANATTDSTASTPVDVPNGDFETIYKPDSTSVTATITGWTQGVGPDCPIDSGVYTFSDETTGTEADIPGWLGCDRDDWITWGGTYSRDETTGNLQGSVSTGNNHTPSGAYCYLANGGSWGNSAGGLIISDASLGTIQSDATYTLSMYANGSATPVVLELLADGVVLTPTSSVSPTLSGTHQLFSRTYDVDDLTSYVDDPLTIVCGVDRDASGTQTHFDDVALEYDSEADTDAPTPDPATFSSAPAAVSSTEVTMTATTGSDASGPVEYYFNETSSNPGATDSGWVTNPVYNDTGLDAGTQYTYTVQMRDSVPNTGTASSGASATTDTSIYEMEDGTLSGPQIASNHAGYTGTGFVDYVSSSGDYVELTVNVSTAGSYDLSYRYALASGDRPLEIKVNGQVAQSSLSFTGTGAWTTWGYTATVQATLTAGDNTVRATAIGSSGANVDHLLVE